MILLLAFYSWGKLRPREGRGEVGALGSIPGTATLQTHYGTLAKSRWFKEKIIMLLSSHSLSIETASSSGTGLSLSVCMYKALISVGASRCTSNNNIREGGSQCLPGVRTQLCLILSSLGSIELGPEMLNSLFHLQA